MNSETLLKLEQSENERVRGIAKLAFILDMDFKETEELLEAMKEQLDRMMR